MRTTYRHVALAFAVLLALVWAVYNYWIRPGAVLTAPVTIITPPPTDAQVNEMMEGAKAAAAEKPAEPKRARISRLLEKGEAIFGGAADRVDVDTGTAADQ
jgi:hypothetical protein